MTISEWTVKIDGSIDGGIQEDVLWKVSLWAVNPLALSLRDSVSVVEASEPVSAHIGGKSPLSEPDLIFELSGI
jgi:hypothetical protein